MSERPFSSGTDEDEPSTGGRHGSVGRLVGAGHRHDIITTPQSAFEARPPGDEMPRLEFGGQGIDEPSRNIVCYQDVRVRHDGLEHCDVEEELIQAFAGARPRRTIRVLSIKNRRVRAFAERPKPDILVLHVEHRLVKHSLEFASSKDSVLLGEWASPGGLEGIPVAECLWQRTCRGCRDRGRRPIPACKERPEAGHRVPWLTPHSRASRVRDRAERTGCSIIGGAPSLPFTRSSSKRPGRRRSPDRRER